MIKRQSQGLRQRFPNLTTYLIQVIGTGRGEISGQCGRRTTFGNLWVKGYDEEYLVNGTKNKDAPQDILDVNNRLQRKMSNCQALKRRKRLQMLKRWQEDVEDFDNEEEEEEAVTEG